MNKRQAKYERLIEAVVASPPPSHRRPVWIGMGAPERRAARVAPWRDAASRAVAVVMARRALSQRGMATLLGESDRWVQQVMHNRCVLSRTQLFTLARAYPEFTTAIANCYLETSCR